MSSQVSGNLNLQVSATLSSAIGTVGTTQLPIQLLQQLAFTNGTGAGKANQLLVLQGTIATSSHVDVDLYANGSVSDAVGNALTMAVGKLLIIQNLGSATPTEADTMTVGGTTATSAWTSFLGTNADSIKLPGPDSAGKSTFICVGGSGSTAYAIGASTTNHLLRISNTGANTITYNVILIGATA